MVPVCYLITLILVVRLFSTPLWGASSIKTVETFDALAARTNAIDADTLVLLDFAKVMCTHKDPWMRGYKKERHATNSMKSFSKRTSAVAQSLSPKKHKQLLATFYQARQYQLVDKTLPSTIAKLQKKGAKIIALTSFKASDNHAIKHQRYNALREHGIDFSKAFPRHKDLTLTMLQQNGKSPTFSRGILSNAGVFSKGDVLRAFFDAIKWQPKRVIFYDDRLDNIESVQRALQPLNIAFEGFVYTGVKQLPAHFDPAVAAYQVQHLVEREQWMHGAIAKKMLERKKK